MIIQFAARRIASRVRNICREASSLWHARSDSDFGALISIHPVFTHRSQIES